MQLTFREIKYAFGIEEKTLYQWLNSLQMPAVKANEQYFFNSVDVLEWALKNKIVLTPGALRLCERDQNNKSIITEPLTRGGIYFGVNGSNVSDVFEKVLELLPLPSHIDRSSLKEMLLSREQIGTTGLGDGIAIPHVKHPVIFAGMEPMVGLFFLENDIDFSAIDGKKVHTLFVIFSSSFKGHLSLLSRLAFCLQDENIKTVLNEHKNREDILATFQIVESKISGETHG